MVIISTDKLPKKYEKDVWDLVVASDGEFVPRLSFRESTTQNNLTAGELECASPDHLNLVPVLPKRYFEIMKKQNFILALENKKVIGFLSHIPNHYVDGLEMGMPCDYISTVIVSPENRGKGITKKLYKRLWETTDDNSLVTRTWSTNFSHLSILQHLGFNLVFLIENDRAQGIDTVYYQKIL